MPELPNPVLEAESIGRMAREDLILPLLPAEIDAVRTIVNSLLEEIRQIAPSNRAGAEPEASVVVEEWKV